MLLRPHLIHLAPIISRLQLINVEFGGCEYHNNAREDQIQCFRVLMFICCKTNQRQYPGHVISLSQSEASIKLLPAYLISTSEGGGVGLTQAGLIFHNLHAS